MRIDAKSAGSRLGASCMRGVGDDGGRRPTQITHHRCHHAQRPHGVYTSIECDDINWRYTAQLQRTASGFVGPRRPGNHHNRSNAIAVQRCGVIYARSTRGFRVTPHPSWIQDDNRLSGTSVIELGCHHYLNCGAYGNKENKNEYEGEDNRACGAGRAGEPSGGGARRGPLRCSRVAGGDQTRA